MSALRQAVVPVKSVFVKVCGCRPHDGGAARTGAGVRKPPMEETAGGVARWRVRRYGDLAAVVTECEYNFCVMCLRAAFVPHRPNKYCHVTASNGIVSSSPYTPLAIMTASPIVSVRVFETSAMRMSARYVRCAPSAVDDISRDHHAEQSSVLGTCFWPLIIIS